MSSRQDNSSPSVLKSWKFWIPIGISIVALAVSIYFACVAKQAREDARAISKLDIYPIVELSTNFQGIRKKPPYFIVKNSGPVPVEQLEVQLLRHMYAAGGTGEGGTTAFAWGSEGLDRVGITVNKNTIPREPASAFYPSGVRLGAPAATTRGMREAEMDQIAAWITDVAAQVEEFRLPDEREARAAELRRFRKAIQDNARLASLRDVVRAFCLRFPVPGTA